MNPPVSGLALLVVAIGGASGSVLRYLAGVFIPPTQGIPLGTLAVNVVGSFLIGVFARMFVAADADQMLRLALTTGFCGGFTTFSAFSMETIALMQQGKVGRATTYVALSLILGLGATMLGLSVVGRHAQR